MDYVDYAELVLELLEQAKYPVLKGHVLIDIYYKIIPVHHPSTLLKRYDGHLHNPQDVYARDTDPFHLDYLLATHPRYFSMHRVDTLDIHSLPTQCFTVKLARSFIDATVLHHPSDSFEEEIYFFLTLLNYDLPRIAHILNLDVMASTRFLPQRVKLWVHHYAEEKAVSHPLTAVERSCFGPPRGYEMVPIRVLSGRLSQCTSQATLLSLNNHHPFQHVDYIHHYAEKWQSVVPLAFNPLENPIIT